MATSELFAHSVIYSIAPQAYNIRRPVIRGGVANVFYADSPSGTFVYRFNSKDIIQHNQKIGCLLRENNIPVPETTVLERANEWVETYRFNPEKTLTERIREGMSEDKIFNAYCEIIQMQRSITEIPLTALAPEARRPYHNVLFNSMKQYVSEPVAHVYEAAGAILSWDKNKKLIYADISPNNVLVDKDGHVSMLLDLDSVAVCNEFWALVRMIRQYPLADYSALLDVYDTTMKRTVNRQQLNNTVHVLKHIRALHRGVANIFLRDGAKRL